MDAENAPPQLQLTTLGGLTIARNGAPVSGFASRKAEALLVYLACRPQPQPREVLATLFWPENDHTRALGNLSVALSSLRKQLGDYVLAERHSIGFNHDLPCVLDCALLEEALATARSRTRPDAPVSRSTAALLEQGVSLYQGDFLAGFNVRGAPEFEGWVLLEQERLRLLVLTAIEELIGFFQARGDLRRAAEYAWRLLALDPLQESVHRRLMLLLAGSGQRAAALAQFAQCREILAAELGVDPDTETEQLAARIAAGDHGPQTANQSSSGPPPAHGLPAATTTFVGRTGELDHIARWLRQPENQILTILGPGGGGKTRLAQEAARSAQRHFVDGARFVSLVPLQQGADVAAALATAVGMALTGRLPVAAQLVDYLASREMLLVLDNFEHLRQPEALDLLGEIVRRAPDVRLLVTSRERLNLHAEALLYLDGLPFVDENENGAAPSLFASRAARVAPDFDLASSREDVERLCRLVDGLPLALELAASWLRALSLPEIIGEIAAGLDILTTTMHDVPARHRSIRAVFDQTWVQLGAEEQQVFAALSVLRGGFSRPSGQAIAGATLPLLAKFVDKALLRLDPDGRYRRHPLLLQYAAEQLARDPQREATVRAAHARYFAAWLADTAPGLVGPTFRASQQAISSDLENVRGAWQWALSEPAPPLLSLMAPGLTRFFSDQARFAEAESLFAAAERRLETLPPQTARNRALAHLKNSHGYFTYQLGRYAEAEATLRTALTLARTAGDTRASAEILKDLGNVTADQGDPEQGRRYLAEAAAVARTLEDQLPLATTLNALGNNLLRSGEYERARTHFHEARLLAQGLKDRRLQAMVDNGLGIVANRQRDFRAAISHYSAAQAAFAALDHRWGVAVTTHNIGMVHVALHEYDEAQQHIEASIALHRTLGYRRGVAGGLAVLGTIARETGRYGAARRHLHAALRLAQEVGVQWSALAALVDLGQLEMAEGNFEEAAFLFAFAADHSATIALSREDARRYLEELHAELPAHLLTRAAARASAATLAGIVAGLGARS